MNRTEFTLNDIEQFLKTEYSFEWVNRQIKLGKTKEYKTAELSDFRSKPVEFVLSKNGDTCYRRIIVSGNRFELVGLDDDVNMNNDKSSEWQEMLYKTYSSSQSVKNKNLTLSETLEYLKEYLQVEHDATWVGGMIYDDTINKCRKINRLDLLNEDGVDLVLWYNNQTIKKHVVINNLIDSDRFIRFVDIKRKQLEAMLNIR